MEVLEMEVLDPVPESPETDTGDTDVEGMPEDPADNGEPESGPEAETTSGEGSEPKGSETEEEPEDQDHMQDPEEIPAEPVYETISGNDIVTISGNAVIFPEGFDLSLLGSSNESSIDQTALIEAVENQSILLYNVSVAVNFLLGVIAGILLVHGFRLRRT